MDTLTVSTKGQVTVPKHLREELKLYPGAKLSAAIDRDGRLVLTPHLHDAATLFATRPRIETSLSLDDIEAAIAAAHQEEDDCV